MSNWQRGRGNYGNDNDGRDEPPPRFPNSGAVWPTKQKRSDNSPDFTGNILIADDVLDYILKEAEGGNEVKLELSAWSRMDRNNNTFTSLKINIPYNVRMEQGGNPTYRPSGRPNFNKRQDERQEYSQPQRRGGYAEQSGRGRAAPRRQDDNFSRGDEMPDFLRDNPDDPPF